MELKVCTRFFLASTPRSPRLKRVHNASTLLAPVTDVFGLDSAILATPWGATEKSKDLS